MPDLTPEEARNVEGLLEWLSDCGIPRELAEPRIALLCAAVRRDTLAQVRGVVEGMKREADEAMSGPYWQDHIVCCEGCAKAVLDELVERAALDALEG